MDAKQYAWLYMIENGRAGRKPSYYGGWDYTGEVIKRFGTMNLNRFDRDIVLEAYRADIKKIGVDWYRTEEPTIETFSSFEGTFNEAGRKNYIIGTLTLNDGSKQYWGAEPLEIGSVFEMMARADHAKTNFTKIFGKRK